MQDPAFITTELWNSLGNTILWLFLFVVTMILGGIHFLLAHALVPSIMLNGYLTLRGDARELPSFIREKEKQIRGALYLGSLFFVSVSIVCLVIMISGIDFVAELYDRWYI